MTTLWAPPASDEPLTLPQLTDADRIATDAEFQAELRRRLAPFRT
jgi:hypothetical protein